MLKPGFTVAYFSLFGSNIHCGCHEPLKTYAAPGSSALLLAYQSSNPGMTEMGENTALPQSTTNDRVSNKICNVHINLFTKNDGIKKTQKRVQNGTSILNYFGDRLLLLLPFCSISSALIPSFWPPTFVSSLPTERLV